MIKNILIPVILFFVITLNAQNDLLKGKVIDENGYPLSFVNIVDVNNRSFGVATDIEGHFKIKNTTIGQQFIVKYIGYKESYFTIEEKNYESELIVQLLPEAVAITDIVVVAGENPAHRIIREAVKNIPLNDVEQYDQFECDLYHKTTIRHQMDSIGYREHMRTRGEWWDDEDTHKRDSAYFAQYEYMKDRIIMMNESVTNYKYKKPDYKKEEIRHNRVSGFKTPEFFLSAKNIQPFGFYKKYIQFSEKEYVNPISKGATKSYFFNLVDTLIQGQDSVFIITFEPKKNKYFNALKGVVYIHTNQYAIKNIIAEPSDLEFQTIRYEQEYEWYPEVGKWFPSQLRFEFGMKNYPRPYRGIFLKGTTYIKSVDLETAIDDAIFDRTVFVLSDSAFVDVDEQIDKYRVDTLTTIEQKTYHMLDSLFQEQNLEGILDITSKLTMGYFPYKKLNVYYNGIRTNRHEGFRLALGLFTNERISEWYKIGGYVGYGFRDKAIKYDASVDFRLHKSKNVHLKASYFDDIRPVNDMLPFNKRSVFSEYYYNSVNLGMHSVKGFKARLSGQLTKDLDASIIYKDFNLDPTYVYQSLEGTSGFDIQEWELNLRFNDGIKGQHLGNNYLDVFSDKPVFYFQLTKGQAKDYQTYDYLKVRLGVEDRFPVWRSWQFSYNLEAGWMDNQLPLPLQFTQDGLGTGYQMVLVSDRFQTIDVNEFVADQYFKANLNFDFGKLFEIGDWSRPSLILNYKFYIGSVNEEEQYSFTHYNTAKKGYHEPGLELNGLYRMNYTNALYFSFGVAAYHRTGYYTRENFKDNVALRLLMNVEF